MRCLCLCVRGRKVRHTSSQPDPVQYVLVHAWLRNPAHPVRSSGDDSFTLLGTVRALFVPATPAPLAFVELRPSRATSMVDVARARRARRARRRGWSSPAANRQWPAAHLMPCHAAPPLGACRVSNSCLSLPWPSKVRVVQGILGFSGHVEPAWLQAIMYG